MVQISSVQFNSVTQLCLTLCDPMDCSTSGFPVHHQHPEFTQTQAHWVGDAIQPSHPLSSPSPPTFNLSQHQGLFKWTSSSHQVAKILEFQIQHQSFQWIYSFDFLYDWLVWLPSSPRDSQESSPTPQLKSINLYQNSKDPEEPKQSWERGPKLEVSCTLILKYTTKLQ